VELPFPQRDLNLKQSEALDRVIAALGERAVPPPQ
jgi:hypothetical protein